LAARVADLVSLQSEDKDKSWQERKQHTIDALVKCNDKDIMMLCLADKLANLRSIAREYQMFGDEVWNRFSAGKEKRAWYYRGLRDSLSVLGGHIFYEEFSSLVSQVFN